MKLRIKGNSIRFRLTPREVNQLCENGMVEEKCKIGDYTCVYRVVSSDEQSLSARMMNGQVQLNVPMELIDGWHQDERVGFEGTDHNELLMSIEKDFSCLQEKENEDTEPLYPNPLRH